MISCQSESGAHFLCAGGTRRERGDHYCVPLLHTPYSAAVDRDIRFRICPRPARCIQQDGTALSCESETMGMWAQLGVIVLFVVQLRLCGVVIQFRIVEPDGPRWWPLCLQPLRPLGQVRLLK